MNPKIVLIDTEKDWRFLLPLTYFREISNIRIGILKIKEKWERLFGSTCALSPVYYLKEINGDADAGELFIRSAVLPSKELAGLLKKLKAGGCLTTSGGDWIACRTEMPVSPDVFRERLQKGDFIMEPVENVRLLRYPWELILLNGGEIKKDFVLMDLPRQVSAGVTVEGDYPVYMHPSAYARHVYIDATEGPVFIGAEVRLLPFTFIKGPAAVMYHSITKAGTRIYNGTTLGPWTKTGGEIKNVLFFGYSNKGHDGFLGDAVVGEWCNFGAGTSNSNLKNNYSLIKFWSAPERKFVSTGQQFLGLVMGDHSKTAINSSVNTGTWIGVSSNIFTRNFPPKFVNSFNWSGERQERNYLLDKAMETARRVMSRRSVPFEGTYERIFRAVWEFSREVEGVE